MASDFLTVSSEISEECNAGLQSLLLVVTRLHILLRAAICEPQVPPRVGPVGPNQRLFGLYQLIDAITRPFSLAVQGGCAAACIPYRSLDLAGHRHMRWHCAQKLLFREWFRRIVARYCSWLAKSIQSATDDARVTSRAR